MLVFIWTIRNEVRRLWRDRTLLCASLLLFTLLGFGLKTGLDWVHFQQETIRTAQAEEKGRLVGLRKQIAEIAAGRATPASPVRDPTRAGNVGSRLGKRWAVLPPAPVFGALAVGQSDLQPFYVAVTTRGKETFLGASELENPLHLLTGRFDLAFVLVYLYPLLLIAVSYNLLSEERENGTLPLLRSQPVSLAAIVGAKAMARALLFVLPVAVVVPAALLLSGGEGMFSPTYFLTGAVMATVISLYGAFWLCLAVFVNAWGKNSAEGAVTLTGAWLLLVVIVPTLAQETAELLYPVPSRTLLIERARAASTEATENGSRLLARYYEDHPELVPATKNADPKDFTTRRYAAQEDVARQVEPLLEQFDRQLTRQQLLAERFRLLSPSIATQEALSDIAGTGMARHRRFQQQVDTYYRDWKAFFTPRVLREERLTVTDIDALPGFVMKEEAQAIMAARTGVALPGLVGACLLLAALATHRLRRGGAE